MANEKTTLIVGVSFLVTRWLAREAQEQARLVSPTEAADPDSRFVDVEGLSGMAVAV